MTTTLPTRQAPCDPGSIESKMMRLMTQLTIGPHLVAACG